MLQSAKIKIRSLKELQADNVEQTINNNNSTTPFKKRKKPTPQSTTTKKQQDDDKSENLLEQKPPPPRTARKLLKSTLKDLPPSQKRIDSFFQSCQKTYKIELPPQGEPPTPIVKITKQQATTKTKKKSTTTKKTSGSIQKRPKGGRKRLFVEPEFTTETETSCSYDSKQGLVKSKMIECITIDSDSEDERNTPPAKSEKEINTNLNGTTTVNQLMTAQLNESLKTPENTANPPNETGASTSKLITRSTSSSRNRRENQQNTDLNGTTTVNQLTTAQLNESLKTPENTANPPNETGASTSKSITRSTSTPRNRSLSSNVNSSTKTRINDRVVKTKESSNARVNKENTNKSATLTPPNSSDSGCPTKKTPSSLSSLRSTASTTTTATKRKYKPCPPYKIIEGTTFAVDAFQYGEIENVTHYFLTHFHMDHYIGLTRSFSKPLYMSPITARFVRTFIPIDERYIHELKLNEPHKIGEIEITALDANHCPGAILLVFNIEETKKYILHTGDFRAWHGMESEPIFWNNDIHTIYLDTTYITVKYDFCQQFESIEKAKNLIKLFQEKHLDKRILYICGSYVIGKEKFWSSLAEEYKWKVWTEGNRFKALKAMEDERLDKLLIEDVYEANLHVIPMAKISYFHLVDYFSKYEQHYDIVFAIRPSGWEKNSKPQYRGKINIIGIEYSEHSSYSEMQRFVKFLKPQHVISTVPTGRNLMVTAEVPQTWYKYDTLKSSSNFQPTIDSCFARTPLKKNMRRVNINTTGLETFVSPLSLANKGKQNRQTNTNNNNNDLQEVLSIDSSKNELEQEIISVKQEPLATKELEISHRNLRNNKTLPNQEMIKIKQEVSANNVQQENQDLGNTRENSRQKNIKKKTPLEKSLKSSTEPPNIVKLEYSALKASATIISQNSSDDFERPDIISSIKKKRPGNKNAKSNLKTIKENDKAHGHNSKKKLLFEDKNTMVKAVPAIQNVKHEYLEQTTINAILDEDFENPQPHCSKRLPIRTNNHISNLPNVKQVISNSLPNSSDNDMEMPLKQKPQEKTNSVTTTISGEEMNLRISQRIKRKTQNPSIKSSNQREDEDKQFEETLEKLSKQPQLSITKNTKTSIEQPKSSIKKSRLNPLIKSNTTSNCSSSNDEIQTKAETPRPLRNKRNNSTQSSHTATSIKKSNPASSREEQKASPLFPISTTIPPSDESRTSVANHPIIKNNHKSKTIKQEPAITLVNTQTLMKEIFHKHKDIDIYNFSQMATLVQESLSQRCLDNSKDHIPLELQISSEGSLSAEETTAFKVISSTTPHRSFSSDKTLSPDVTTTPQTISNNTSNYSSSKQCSKQQTPRPLGNERNGFTSSSQKAIPKTLNYSSSLDEIPSHSKQPTPRPLSNKRNGLTSSSQKATPIKKWKDQASSSDKYVSCSSQTFKNTKQQQPTTSNENSQTLINDILNNNKDIDIYNSSQMATLVEESLSKRCLDTSNDHIPNELLSDPDADDDWMY